jgi:hypothetical protein
MQDKEVLLVHTLKSKVSHNDLSQQISTNLRWELYHKIKFGTLVSIWYHYNRNHFAEPVVQLEDVLQEEYFHEY